MDLFKQTNLYPFLKHIYLGFDHVQHMSQIFKPPLQLPQPVISLCLRNRLYPLRRSWGPEHYTSLQLVTLDVMGVIKGLGC